MEKIKLVIWDLDETFWKGTISDGEVEPIPENIEIVKKLTDRGIVNSICSKNDHEVAKNELIKEGVWDYFVFSSIDWTAKGARVKQIIEDMNLRPVNVIFVDDNINNLKEASYITEGLQTALPDEFIKLTKDKAFEGKDDSDHTRLKQYKILETKTEARKNSASNEEFLYQSEIKVELFEDCSDQLERIHEMIHRNNQLNYTKDRITEEEVKKIFTDPDIRSGYVKVKDKFGDHGIVGCYAVKDGKTLQLVLSCRILGMGVEQWLYSELGYPELKVEGEVASELNKNDRPGWINMETSPNSENDEVKENKSATGKRFIAYGTCPLRPVWAYIEPQLTDPVFAEIDPGPSVCNLGVIAREDEGIKKEWLDQVKILDGRYTFYPDVFDEDTGFVFITLDGEFTTYKYTSKKTGKRFYSRVALSSDNASKNILEEYSREKVSIEDIKEELVYVLEHLHKGCKLLLMTVPEVVFPSLGEDEDYRSRIRLNELAEELDRNFDNLYLIDIRKYAKSPADFFDTCSNHYNRVVGSRIANEMMKVINSSDSGISFEDNSDPDLKDNIMGDAPENAVYKEVSDKEFGEIKTCAFIRNGIMVSKVMREGSDNSDYEYKHVFVRGRFIENETDWSDKEESFINIDKTGIWWVTVYIRKSASPDPELRIENSKIDYSIQRIIEFFDPEYSMYTENIPHVSGKLVSGIISDSEKADKVFRMNNRLLSEIAASGVNFADYFKESDIGEISVFTDRRTGEIIIPFILSAGIRIKNVYSADSKLFTFDCTYGDIQVKHLNKDIDLTEKDDLLFATDHYQWKLFLSLFDKTGCRIHWLNKILCCTKTNIFMKRFLEKNPGMISPVVVRSGAVKRFYGMSFTFVNPFERKLEKLDNDILTKKLKNNKFIAPYYKTHKEELLQTLVKPASKKDKEKGISKFKNISSDYLNIKGGVRKTAGNPKEYEGTVYVFGGRLAFGSGVRDEKTIASYITSMLEEPYRVVNYANSWGISNFSETLNLMESIDYEENDIVVLITENWLHESWAPRTHWFEWDALNENEVIKVDTFPAFKNPDRGDYFILPYAYSPEGNKKVAELIVEGIRSSIKDAGIKDADAENSLSDELQMLKEKVDELNKKMNDIVFV